MELTKHFTLEELTYTSSKQDNTPSEKIKQILKDTAEKLEVIRKVIGNRSIIVNSAFRSPAVNKAVGGAKNSAHLTGYAVDFVVKGLTPLQICDMIDKAEIKYDQLIDEDKGSKWVHISFDPRLRQQRLIYKDGKYELYKK